jgi:hypothetical protein
MTEPVLVEHANASGQAPVAGETRQEQINVGVAPVVMLAARKDFVESAERLSEILEAFNS